MSLKNGLKNALVSTVIFKSGYCSVNARNTGTVIATSPIAENLMTSMWFGFLDIIYNHVILSAVEISLKDSSLCSE